MIAKTHPSVSVVGVDPSAKMLEVGEKKLTVQQLNERVTLQVGDAQALEFPDRTFDGLTIAFGIRNVPDRLQGLREMARVTKAGGRVAILELSEPRSGVLGPLARFHVHSVVPTIGALLSGAKEYHYLQKSIAAFPPAEEFEALMVEAGLRIVASHALTFGVCHLYVGEPLV
jgi:demethylmenaquinone methyltransferase/2-methoxy-6-polyprenyl-1,4-benzoquinol methylase